MEHLSTIVDERAGKGIRLDRYVAECVGILSRSQLKARGCTARCNGKAVKLSRIVYPGDQLELWWESAPPVDLLPQDIPLDILYEDASVVVINKAAGMVVHPGAAHREGTIANAILFRRLQKMAQGNICGASPVFLNSSIITFKKEDTVENVLPEDMNPSVFSEKPLLKKDLASPLSSIQRPGIVHRLDKDTTGVLIATYEDEALAFLAAQFKNRNTRKTYLSIVQGNPPASHGKIETFLTRDPSHRQRFTWSTERGKQAITFYRVLRLFRGYALVALFPRTGRTHQLRVHMKYLGCPILGDSLYGKKDGYFPDAPLMLHAFRLTILLPGTTEPRTFVAPLPEAFKAILRRLENQQRMAPQKENS
ncbi:MAG: RluA family pseudouridine synthase [Treponemataceae bacterium]|nr:RluA family pseudouridine synthase [Treponemataceae bacterium]